jgi:hypothetical protein
MEWFFGELHGQVGIMGARQIANTAWGLAKMRVSPSHLLWVDVVRRSLQLKARDFEPQNIANLMWAFATAGVSPGETLVRTMSAEAVSKSKDFKPQEIANLMWALSTSGVSSDAALVRAMSAEAVSKSKDFNPQEIGNLIWAFAASGVSPDAVLVQVMMDEVSAGDLNSEGRTQLHLFFLFNSLSAQPSDVSSWAELAAECKEAFVAHSSSSTDTSKLQKDVARALRRLVSEEVLEEQVLEDSSFSVDARIAGTRVAIKVDGPYHYLRGEAVEAGQGRVLNSSTRFKHRTLTQLSWTVVQVPYFEWNALNGKQDQARYLATLLASAGVPASVKE